MIKVKTRKIEKSHFCLKSFNSFGNHRCVRKLTSNIWHTENEQENRLGTCRFSKMADTETCIQLYIQWRMYWLPIWLLLTFYLLHSARFGLWKDISRVSGLLLGLNSLTFQIFGLIILKLGTKDSTHKGEPMCQGGLSFCRSDDVAMRWQPFKWQHLSVY